MLSSEEFYKFIMITGKDFSGGYKSITSKQIKTTKFTIKTTTNYFSMNEFYFQIDVTDERRLCKSHS